MSVLLALPEEVAGKILGDWLCVKQIAALNTAMCSRTLRQIFKSLMGKFTMVHCTLKTLSLKKDTLAWIEMNRIMYPEIEIYSEGFATKKELLKKILIGHNPKSLRRLKFRGDLGRTSNSAHAYAAISNSANLEAVLIEQVAFSGNALHMMAAANPRLLKLHILQCQFVSRKSCAAIAQHCQLLQNLDLRMSDIDDTGITLIVQSCSKLIGLELFGCQRITDKGITAIALNGSKLVHLSISGTSATEVSVTAIARGCPRLKGLNIERVPLFDAKHAAEVGKGCHFLESLSFVGCGTVTDDALIALATHCLQLLHLFLNECSEITDVGLCAIAGSCPNLRYISLTRPIGRRYPQAVNAFRKSVRVHLEEGDELVPPD